MTVRIGAHTLGHCPHFRDPGFGSHRGSPWKRLRRRRGLRLVWGIWVAWICEIAPTVGAGAVQQAGVITEKETWLAASCFADLFWLAWFEGHLSGQHTGTSRKCCGSAGRAR